MSVSFTLTLVSYFIIVHKKQIKHETVKLHPPPLQAGSFAKFAHRANSKRSARLQRGI